MNRRRLAALALLAGSAAFAQSARPTDPPDPRRGERLDGREEPEDPQRPARVVGDVLLTVPRWIVEAIAWPVVRLAQFVERNHLVDKAYWALTSDDMKSGLRPEARYETGLIASVGARYFNRRTLGPGSLVEFLARTGGPHYLYGQLRLVLPHETSLATEWRTVFEASPRQLFAGTHGESASELRDQGRDVATYGIYRSLSTVGVEGAIAGTLWLSLRTELDVRRYTTTDSLDQLWCADPGTTACQGAAEDLIPGFHEGMRLVRLRGAVRVDTREGPRLGGVRLELEGTVAHGILSDPSRLAKLVADGRIALDLSDSLLILRLNAGVVGKLGDAPVPFEELLSPTGTYGLRGMPAARLRGHSQLMGTIEYRWLLTPYLDAAVFIDQGGAFDEGFSNLSLSRMIPSYGFGLRIHEVRADYWNAETLIRFQFAYATGEGGRIMLGLGND